MVETRLCWLLTFLFSLLLGSCGGVSGTKAQLGTELPLTVAGPASPRAALPLLPDVASLPRRVSVEDGSRWEAGSDFDSSLPYANVEVELLQNLPPDSGKFDRCVFSPSWEAGTSSSPGGLAWAIYSFDSLHNYDNAKRVYTRWINGDPADVWIALANFATGRWEWFHNAGSYSIDLPDLAPYIDTYGQIYAAVMLTGTQQRRLEYILLGDPLLDWVDWTNDLPEILDRVAPLNVFFNVGDYVLVGSETAVLFEMDFEGDGIFDSEDTVFNNVYAHGNFTPTLRVTDDLGRQHLRSFPLLVINPNNQMPVASFTPANQMEAAPLKVNFDASSSMDPDGQITKYEWDFDNDGKFDLSSTEPLASYTFVREGSNPVTLRVTDNDLATATFNGDMVCVDDGWRLSILDNVSVSGRITAMRQWSGTDARVCVAYYDSTNHDLKFVRSTDELGTMWGSPVIAVNGSSMLQQGQKPSIALESLSGCPAVAYVRRQFGPSQVSLMYVRANATTGDFWGTPVEVEASISETTPHLSQFGTKLTIAAVESEVTMGSTELRVYQSTGAAGTTWNPPLIVAVPDGYTRVMYPQILKVPGLNPLIGVVGNRSSSMEDYDILIAQASASDASAWAAASATPNPAGVRDTSFSLAIVNGQPAYALGGGSASSVLRFRRANDPQGTDWTMDYTLVDDEPGKFTGEHASLAEVDGKPCVAYAAYGSDLRFIRALDAEGSGWEEPQLVDTAGNVGLGCVLVDMEGIPVIVYRDMTNQRVKAAAFF